MLGQREQHPQGLLIEGFIPCFVALINHYYCHPIPPQTPILTISAVVLSLSSNKNYSADDSKLGVTGNFRDSINKILTIFG